MKTLLSAAAVGFLAVNAAAFERPTPNATFEIVGAGDFRLAVQEWGAPDGPAILFSHAWSLSHIAWLPQITGALAERYRLITYDLRGHGDSQKDEGAENYNNSDVWADDIHAIITALDLRDLTAVGWSYSSVALADYIKKYGESRLSGFVLNGGLSGLGVERVAKYFGTDFDPTDALSSSALAQAQGMVGVVNIMVPKDLSRDVYGVLLASAMAAPPHVRGAMLDRRVDHESTYRALTIPVLFTHGAADGAVLPLAAEEGVSFTQNGTLSLYENANHGPNWTDPERFDRELAAFVDATR